MRKLISEIEYIYKNNAEILYTPGYLNIIGIRHPEKVNAFNDELYYFWYSNLGELQGTTVLGGFTTDPGKYYLNNPLTDSGCAILEEGFYPKLWKYGYHRNKYPALVQNSACKVYRDGNRDDILDYDATSSEEGIFGINLHRANQSITSTRVDKWSAGCQVIASPVEFNDLMTKVEIAVNLGQVEFPYLLLNINSLM